ncbi:TetR/AcrR family transcriptional regulator [Virgibacillus necropolis]|uniref:TetR/AcrR family transcriptional regulator n=1 Tax=Virgibacillus necropolis TaxID=163877 RepID=UPI00384BAFCC
MSGLREKKKKQNQKNIIQSAKRIFAEKGFQNSSMAEIAKDAEVGTGTIYNYFSSKGAILLTIFFDDIEQIQNDNQLEIANHSGQLVEEIMQLMMPLTEFFNHYTKSFWREIMHVITGEVEDSLHLRKGMFGLDAEMIGWIKQIIEKHSDCFLVPTNPEEAANAIYGVAMLQSMLFIYDEKMTYEQFLDQLTRQIQFLFSGKIKR